MDDFIILIPALNPPKEIFNEYLDDLLNEGFDKILVVDDGSDNRYRDFLR